MAGKGTMMMAMAAIAAVAIAVFDDIGQPHQMKPPSWTKHDEEGDNSRTDNGTLADFLQHMDFRENVRCKTKDG